jgi:hypothetical protein
MKFAHIFLDLPSGISVIIVVGGGGLLFDLRERIIHIGPSFPFLFLLLLRPRWIGGMIVPIFGVVLSAVPMNRVTVVLLFWLVRILFVMWLRAVRLIVVMRPWLPLCARLSWLARVLTLLLRVRVRFVVLLRLLWAVRLVVAMWRWLIYARGLGLLQAVVRIRFVLLLRLLWVVPLIVAMRL